MIQFLYIFNTCLRNIEMDVKGKAWMLGSETMRGYEHTLANEGRHVWPKIQSGPKVN
jgi:hypothetical protein